MKDMLDLDAEKDDLNNSISAAAFIRQQADATNRQMVRQATESPSVFVNNFNLMPVDAKAAFIRVSFGEVVDPNTQWPRTSVVMPRQMFAALCANGDDFLEKIAAVVGDENNPQ